MNTSGILVLSFLLTVWNVGLATEVQQSAAEYVRRAQAYLVQQNFKQAMEAAQMALRLDPQSAEAESLLGTAKFALGELDAAQSHFRRALEIAPGLIPARRSLGATYLKQKRLKEAQHEFELVLASHPHEFVSLSSLGLIFLLEDQPVKALDQFEKAYRLNPADAALLMGILEARLKLKQEAGAAATLAELDARLTAHDPRRLQVAALLALEGSLGLAIQEYEHLRKVQPDSYEINYNLALAYHRAGKESEAALLLQRLLAHRENGELQNLLAEVEDRRGNPLAALRAYRRAAELDPRNEDYRFDDAQALVQRGALDLALEAFAAATKDFPASVRMWLGWGAAYYLKGSYEDAARTFLRAAEIAPQAPGVYYLLGRAYGASASLQDAIARQFSRYLSTEPHDPWAHYFYGKILAARNRQGLPADLKEAKRHLEKALVLANDLAEAHLELGNVLEAQGEIEAARRELERAVELDPKSSAAYYRLGQLYRRLGDVVPAEHAF